MPRDKDGFRRFFQRVEQSGLKHPLRLIADKHGATLFDVYMDVRTEAATAARVETWWWLVAVMHRSIAEAAALFDRDRSSVVFAFRKLAERAEENGVRVAEDTVEPLAKLVVRSSRTSAP